MNNAIEAMARAIVYDLRRQSQVQRGVAFDYEPLAGVADVSMSIVVHEVARAAYTAALTALAENITPEMVRAGHQASTAAEDSKEVFRAMCAAAVKGEG